MTVQANMELPPAHEIGHWVAWTEYAHTAVEAACSLDFGHLEQGQRLYHMGEELQGGQNITVARDYEQLVFAMARNTLPAGKPDRDGTTAWNGTTLSTVIDKAFPRSQMKLPANLKTVGSQADFEMQRLRRMKENAIQDMALAEALTRLGFARREQRAKLTWPAGMVAAAGYFRANIREPFDRAVYEVAPEIEKTAKSYSRIRHRLAGRTTIYEVAGRKHLSQDTRVPGYDNSVRAYGLFWAELDYDRQRFLARQAELQANE